MRVSRTLLALAPLLFVTACGPNSPELVAPASENPTKSGTWIGSGTSANDSTFTGPVAERGIGWSGSGN